MLIQIVNFQLAEFWTALDLVVAYTIHLGRVTLLTKLILETGAERPCQVNPVIRVSFVLPAGILQVLLSFSNNGKHWKN